MLPAVASASPRAKKDGEKKQKPVEMPHVLNEQKLYFLHDTSSTARIGDLSRSNMMKHGINPQWLQPYQARRREQTFRWEMESLQRTTEWRVFKSIIKNMELKARRSHAELQIMKWDEVLRLRDLLKQLNTRVTLDQFYDRLSRASPTGTIKEGRLLTAFREVYRLTLGADTSHSSAGKTVSSRRSSMKRTSRPSTRGSSRRASSAATPNIWSDDPDVQVQVRPEHALRPPPDLSGIEYRRIENHRPSSAWAKRHFKKKPIPPKPRSVTLQNSIHKLYTAFASQFNGQHMDYRELICALKLVTHPNVSCRAMILMWAAVYATHGKMAHPVHGRLKSTEFMQLWALPAMTAQESEEYMFQAHVALYQIRSKSSRIDDTVTLGQVAEMLDGPVLGPLMKPSPAAVPPRIPFALYEYKMYHPAVQKHLWKKRKAYADGRIAMYHFALVTWRKVLIAWRLFRRGRRKMREFLSMSADQWEANAKRSAFERLRESQGELKWMGVPATEIQRIWRGFMPRKMLAQYKRELDAYEDCQKVVRGFLARVRVKRLCAAREVSAVEVQRTWRGFVARKRVRRQLIASVKAREAVIREHLRQRKREREARAAIVLQALWRGHRVYQAEKQRRAAEKKAESEVAAWEAAKQLELDQYKAALEYQIKQEGEERERERRHQQQFRRELEALKWKKRFARWKKAKERQDQEDRELEEAVRAERHKFKEKWRQGEINARSDARGWCFNMLNGPRINKELEPDLYVEQQTLDQRLKILMKQHKSKARSEKRVDYTVEVNIAEATEELCSQVVLEKLESEFFPAKLEAQHKFDREQNAAMMSRDAERKAALQRKRGKAEKYMKLMIRRRFARLEMFKRFYATWTKEYDPVSGQPFYQNHTTGEVKWYKPYLIKEFDDLDMEDRWYIRFDQGGHKFFFNPAQHKLAFTLPPLLALCVECEERFATARLQEGAFCKTCMDEWDVPKHFLPIDGGVANVANTEPLNEEDFGTRTVLEPPPPCVECEEAPGVVWCNKCEDSFCEACSSDYHLRGKARLHELVSWEDHLDPDHAIRDAAAEAERAMQKRLMKRQQAMDAKLAARKAKRVADKVDPNVARQAAMKKALLRRTKKG